MTTSNTTRALFSPTCTAYFVAWIEANGMLGFVDVFSEPSPTCKLNEGTWAVIGSAESDVSYSDARDRLMYSIAAVPVWRRLWEAHCGDVRKGLGRVRALPEIPRVKWQPPLETVEAVRIAAAMAMDDPSVRVVVEQILAGATVTVATGPAAGTYGSPSNPRIHAIRFLRASLGLSLAAAVEATDTMIAVREAAKAPPVDPDGTAAKLKAILEGRPNA